MIINDRVWRISGETAGLRKSSHRADIWLSGLICAFQVWQVKFEEILVFPKQLGQKKNIN